MTIKCEFEQGLAIRSARMAAAMTQAHLAVASGTSEKTVRRAEAGTRISPESLRGICSVLDLDAATLRREADEGTSIDLRETRRFRWSMALTACAVLVPALAGIIPLSLVLVGCDLRAVVHEVVTYPVAPVAVLAAMAFATAPVAMLLARRAAHVRNPATFRSA